MAIFLLNVLLSTDINNKFDDREHHKNLSAQRPKLHFQSQNDSKLLFHFAWNRVNSHPKISRVRNQFWQLHEANSKSRESKRRVINISISL